MFRECYGVYVTRRRSDKIKNTSFARGWSPSCDHHPFASLFPLCFPPPCFFIRDRLKCFPLATDSRKGCHIYACRLLRANHFASSSCVFISRSYHAISSRLYLPFFLPRRAGAFPSERNKCQWVDYSRKNPRDQQGDGMACRIHGRDGRRGE